MRSVIIALVFVCGLAAQPGYKSKILNTVNAVSGSFTTTSTISVAAGDTLWVMWGSQGSCGGSTWTVTGGAAGVGDTFTQVGANNDQTFACGAQFKLETASANATYAVKITPSGSFTVGIIFVVSISAAVQDVNAGSSCNHFLNGTGSNSCSLTLTTGSNDMVVAGIFSFYFGDTYVAGTGFTIPAGGTIGTTGYGSGALEYSNPSVTTAAATISGTGYSIIMATAFYAPAGNANKTPSHGGTIL